MNLLLQWARWIDTLNRHLGRAMAWPILGAIAVSAGNAISRKFFGVSSNAWLEVQWHLFALSSLGCAGYVLLVNEHVRVDAWSSRRTPRTRAWIDIAGLLLCALPMTALIGVLSAELFARRFASGEIYVNAGGLPVWPVVLTMPLGMALLALQCLSELVRRVAFLRGRVTQAELDEAALPRWRWSEQGGTTNKSER
ncbi:MAG TPA: TRAP transporter small permease subunit [Burkholderiaceae bacterium]|nr:TRAP transporter small permease subunit [Burkholderiaceae bacterium]